MSSIKGKFISGGKNDNVIIDNKEIKNFKQGDVWFVHGNGQAPQKIEGVKIVPSIYRDCQGNYHLTSLSLVSAKNNEPTASKEQK